MTDARGMLACLANVQVSRVFANIVLHGNPGTELAPSRQRKAVDALVRSGLVTRTGDDLSFDPAATKTALADLVAVSSDKGIDTRWTDTQGRITHYPRRSDDRARLLQQIGEQALKPGERLTEANVNARLERFTADVPTLRRYLIVHGILARESDGSAYWRP